VSDIVISGYYGLGNSGDEALLKSIVDDLHKINPELTITALSGNAKLTRKQYKIKTVNRFNPFLVLRELLSAKLLLSGGGTLIQDATSTKSLLYYLGIIRLAKLIGLKVMLYANGIGPLKDKNVRIVEKTLNKVDLITLRENISLDELKRCRVEKPKVFVTADPAFSLVPESEERADEILKEFGIPLDKKLLAVSVRGWKKLDCDFEEKMAKAIDELSEKGLFPVFMPMQMKTDIGICERIMEKMKTRACIIERELPVSELLAIIGKASVACGMRLHMLIFASVMKVPMAGIVYDKKIKGFMDYMGQKNYVPLENFSIMDFVKSVEFCDKEKEQLRAELSESALKLREKALLNAKLASELIK